MERKDFSLPQITPGSTKNGAGPYNTGYGAGQTDRSMDQNQIYGRSGMSPTLSSPHPQYNSTTNAALSAKNAFGGRRYTEVNPSVVAGIKMREQQQILKEQMQKN